MNCATWTPKAKKMAALIADLDKSGMGVKEFSSQKGVSAPVLYYWQRRLEQLRLEDQGEEGESPAVVPVSIQLDPQVAKYQIEIPMGWMVHVPPGFSIEELRRLLRVVYEVTR